MPAPATHGPWSPLGQPTFRALWLAILVGNIGTWIHDVAAAWVMAETTNSPLMVAAVQSATTLPVVLLAIIAGTLADIVDRRRYLILAQLWMLLVASTLDDDGGIPVCVAQLARGLSRLGIAVAVARPCVTVWCNGGLSGRTFAVFSPLPVSE